MRSSWWRTILTLGLAMAGATPAVAADRFAVDPVHTSVTFKIPHLGISWIHGRFNDVSGAIVLDKENPEKSSFTLAVKTESVDTNNKQRDTHLRSPTFFNSKQFPVISFKSTSVKPVRGGYEVTGDLTMHGVTRPVRFVLQGGKEAEFPKGFKRTGFATELTLKRSDFGMDKFQPAVGDEVRIGIGLEGVRKAAP